MRTPPLSSSWHFKHVASLFVLSILPEIIRISFRFLIYKVKLKLSKSKRNWVFIESTKKADILEILEIPELEVFSDWFLVIFISKVLVIRLGWLIKAASLSKNQRRPSRRFATVMFCWTPCVLKDKLCFVGHPVYYRTSSVLWDTLCITGQALFCGTPFVLQDKL